MDALNRSKRKGSLISAVQVDGGREVREVTTEPGSLVQQGHWSTHLRAKTRLKSGSRDLSFRTGIEPSKASTPSGGSGLSSRRQWAISRKAVQRSRQLTQPVMCRSTGSLSLQPT